ncbi:MAG: hypothetical protein K0S65_3792 [Labilithrix sp.]|nr:hypothetical protein [Labilithrix sp.]
MTPAQRAAIGDTKHLPRALARALRADGFSLLPAPGASDWLRAHPERGQTFADYVASHPMRSGESRRTLALLPIGVPVGDAAGNAPPGLLRTYAEAFFQMPTRLLPSVSLEEMQVRRRTNSFTGKEQLLAPDVLAYLKSKLPNDAFAVCGFTNEDLYPEESWNFVFGQASMWERVGVFSFARYDPTFFGAPREKGHERAMRRRCINVLAHETSHMFGLAHCVFFACLMNGSNHLAVPRLSGLPAQAAPRDRLRRRRPLPGARGRLRRCRFRRRAALDSGTNRRDRAHPGRLISECRAARTRRPAPRRRARPRFVRARCKDGRVTRASPRQAPPPFRQVRRLGRSCHRVRVARLRFDPST